MKICSNCGSSYDDSLSFCVQCGTPLTEAPAQAPVSEAVEQEVPAQEIPAQEIPAAEIPAEEIPAAQPVQPEAQYQAPQPEYQQPQYQPAPGFVPPYQAPVAPDPDDHTPEMDPEDIKENKLYAILVYLLGPIGIIIALLKDKESKFLNFHVRLSIKYLIVETILLVITAVLSFTIIIGIAGGVCLIIVAVLEIITFVQACKGQAKDPAIIKKIKFLN